ncbi:PLP-dependent aminotransferase family protein [Thalassoglobus sp. JC818]|uniref:aminotransferase-like domain-containing protein n=1 Tax=Thalassoglobus sp. JC818 TaxID=3232136 RepID=UPI0034591283
MKTSAELPVLMSQRSKMTKDLAISFLMQQGVENPDCLSLAAGLVDPATLPVEETLRASQQVLATKESGMRALQYGTTPGSAELRSELLSYFAELEKCSVEDLGIDASQMILTTGSQQLLSLVCETLLDPGDICLVAGPTYFVFAGNLAGVGARTVTIPSDEEGMDPAALDHALEQIASMEELHRVKLIYVVSYYDNPSGVCLSTSRREQIVEIAQKYSREHRLLVLEDAAYRELRYDGEEHPSMWGFDQDRSSVIYTQTFSKTFSPGIRVGFGIVPKELVTAICERKGNEDFGSAHFNQKLIAEVLRSGAYRGHLAKVRDGYRLKRDAMLAAAEKYFSDLPGVSWVHPKGGLYVWMTLPASIQSGFDSPLFSRAVEHGVMYVPGELCYAGPLEDRPRSQLRLSYGVLTVELIDEAMRRLADAVREMQSARPSNDVWS